MKIVKIKCRKEIKNMKARKIGYSVNITIPKEVVEQMGIKDGDKLDWKVEDLKLIITNPNDVIYLYSPEEPQELKTNAELQMEKESFEHLDAESERSEEQIILIEDLLSKIKNNKQKEINEISYLSALNINKEKNI